MLTERLAAVEQVNETFYLAFTNLDIKQMEGVWAMEDSVTCIHPGWSLRAGWPAVRDSWVMIFNHTFSMRIRLSDIVIQVAGDVAWVVCMEHLTSGQAGEEHESRVLATNIFERQQGQWRMIHHHGSPVM